MERIIENIQNKLFTSNRSLQKELQFLNPEQLRNISIQFNIIDKNSKKFKSQTLIQKIISYYNDSKCSVENPCPDPDDSCHIDTGKCKKTIKTTINDKYGQNIPVIGDPEHIESIQNNIEKEIQQEDSPMTTSHNSVIDYRLSSFYAEGMVDTKEDGNCFFECVQKLLQLTHNVEYSISSLRDKISQTVKLFTLLQPPLLDDISLINEVSNISSVDQYVSHINLDGWAGEPEIIATSSLYNKIIIIKTLKLNIPDRIYYPSTQLPNRNVQPGLWIFYHVNTEESNDTGTHYQYKGNLLQSQTTGSITNVSTLEKIIDLLETIDQPKLESMSILSSDGIQYAGDPRSLEVLNNKGIIDTQKSQSENVFQDIEMPEIDQGVVKPDEGRFIKSLQSKPMIEQSSLQTEIKNFLHPLNN